MGSRRSTVSTPVSVAITPRALASPVSSRATATVLGRFSLGGGQPSASDTASAVRGLGLQFSLPDGELWRTAMLHLPVFPFRTPEAFYEQLFAFRPDPSTGQPDPEKVQAFLAHHPESAEVLKVIKSQPAPTGFGD